ncbi:MAG: diguanylate cyclase [Patescibacteria group bacterium]
MDRLYTKKDLYSLVTAMNGVLENLPLVYVDGDFLKEINFHFSRKVGDNVINGIDGLIHIYLDSLDLKGVIFRFGGDEFIVIPDSIQKCKSFVSLFNVEPCYTDSAFDFFTHTRATASFGMLTELTSKGLDLLVTKLDKITACCKRRKYSHMPSHLTRLMCRHVWEPVELDSTYSSASDFTYFSFVTSYLDTLKLSEPLKDSATGLYNITAFQRDFLSRVSSIGEDFALYYFDMVSMKEITKYLGRELYTVPLMLQKFFFLNMLAQPLGGTLYRIGGDEGVIIFNEAYALDIFEHNYVELSSDLTPTNWCSGYVLDCPCIDLDKDQLTKYESSAINSLPKDLLTLLLPPQITSVAIPSMQEYLQTNNEVVTSTDILNYFESSVNSLKCRHYRSLSAIQRSYLSRTIY